MGTPRTSSITKYGRPGIEDPGDVWVVHQRQGLELGLESREDLMRVHAGPDDLERHLPPDRSLLIGDVDDAEPPLADLLQQRVGADHGACAFGGRWNERCGNLGRGRL